MNKITYFISPQVNLGTLYHCKAVITPDKDEKEKYFAKAEDYLHSGCKCDLAYGFIRLAHLYYQRGFKDKAMAFLNKMMKHFEDESGKENQVSLDVYDNTQFGAFRKELWRPWIEGKYAYDIMFCKMLNPTCPAEMTKSFTLAQCQMLGIRVQSIATFSVQFFSAYLIGLCYMEAHQYDQADKILSSAEETCTDEPQTDLNDKRIAGYLNTLARCYIRMENMGRARYVIHNSLRTYPSPRNPARFLRYQLDYGDSWGYVKQGFRLVMLSALTYAIVQYVRAHLRLNS